MTPRLMIMMKAFWFQSHVAEAMSFSTKKILLYQKSRSKYEWMNEWMNEFITKFKFKFTNTNTNT